ncbi:MAG: PAS domain S-box protein, partial [Candidatus Omnitrophota bacterium]
VRWNSNLEEVSGYSSSEVSKMDPTDFFSKEEKGIIADKIHEIFTQGKLDVEASIITKAGRAIPYHLTGLRLIVYDERYFVGVGIDIADRKKAEAALRLTQFSVNKTSDPVYWIAPDAQIKYVNDTACSSLGYSREELLSMHVYDFDPNYPKKMWKKYWEYLRSGKSTSMESVHRAKDGTTFPVEVTANYIKFEGKEYNCAFARNITDRKRAEAALRDSEEKFRAIFDNSTDGIVVINPHSKKIFMFNKTIADMLGYTEEGFKALNPEDFHVKEDWPYIKKKFDKMMKKDISEVGDIPVVKKDGTIFYSSITSYTINISGDELIVTVFKDITERKKAEQKLEILNKYLIKTNEKLQLLAMRDYHTGLYNYHYLVDIIEAELNRAKRYASALSVIMIDIDYFKSINEIYGSKAGDMVLKQFSIQLKKAVRKYDIVIRFGGEEFVILCPSTDRAAANVLAGRILEAIGVYNFGTKEQSIKLKLSIGSATFPDARVIKGMDLIEASEKATNEAKYSGGNRVADFNDIKDKKIKGDIKAKANVSGLKRRLDRLTKETNQSLVEAIFAFAKTIELKDHYTGEHVERTVHYATELARKLNMIPQEIERIRQAAVLHDLGKIGISDKILLKKSKLTPKEYDTIKKHPQIAADILRPIQILHNIIPYIFYHHERWNGTGYPSGLKGDEIPMGARIIALADVYQALSSDRPYRKAYNSDRIKKIIKEGSGTQFDPKIVKAFMDLLKKEKKKKK